MLGPDNTYTYTCSCAPQFLSGFNRDVVIFYPRKVVHDKFPTYTCSFYFSETLRGCQQDILSFQDSKAQCFILGSNDQRMLLISLYLVYPFFFPHVKLLAFHTPTTLRYMGMWICFGNLKHRKELLSFSQMASPYTKSIYLLIIRVVKIAPLAF